MASVNESLGKTDLNSQLKDGLDVISLNQQVTFTLYNRIVLPIDGYVFLVKADLYNPISSLFNTSKYNAAYLDQHSKLTTAARVINPKGSVHYSTDNQQNYDETIAVQTVTFTAQEEIQDFKQIGPNSVYIATFDGIRYAFTERAGYYKQANLYHYRGDAIYPAMLSNVIDDPRQFNNRLVATNSTPIWLGLNSIMPVYPAHLVPQNLPPPYAAFEITNTKGVGAAPMIDGNGNHSQLVRDLVKVTIYGIRNDSALDYQDYVFQYSLDSDAIGIMNVPVVVDEKRTQSELSIIAMKKSIEFEVNYYQNRAKEIARQLILNAGLNISIDYVKVVPQPTFNVLNLFGNGEQGVWYDPSDFSTLFQDVAGTIPVTAIGQPVGLMLDKSGNGNNAFQSTTANRPVLQQDAGGHYYLAFNGTNSSMATAAINFTATDKMTVVAGVRKLSDAALGLMIELSADVLINNGTFWVAAPFSGNTYEFASKGTILSGTPVSGYTAPITSVIAGSASISTPSIVTRINQISFTDSGTQGTGNYGNYPLYIGARAGTSLFFNGNLYSLIVRGAASSSAQIQALETYVNSKTGAY